jgi:tetratricopeptide (TPR) repeat protein
VHGLSNFMVRLGDTTEMLFTTVITAASFLVLGRLKRTSPYALRDLGRPREALQAIEAALVHDPGNCHLHLKAAHFRLRSGDPRQAVAHLEKFLAARPDDPYATGLLGASLVLAGDRAAGEQALELGRALMSAQSRRIFHRNLWRLLAPGRGRLVGEPRFDESLLRTLLLFARLREKAEGAALS